MTPNEAEIRGAIAQQAGEWFIANQGGPLADEESAAFLAWLKASPIHVEEYLGVARVAHGLKRVVGESHMPLETFLAQVRAADDRIVPIVLPKPRPQRRAPHSSASWSRPLVTSLAASLVVIVAAALWWIPDGEWLGLPKTYQTARGEQLARHLPDGSVVHLDTDTAVTVRYSGRERVVELNRGRALFEVVHGERRFRVAAGDAGAIAVGTRFDVYRRPSATVITVADGLVAVFGGKPGWLRGGVAVPADVPRVKAGYQLRVDAGGTAEQPVAVDLGEALGWLEHKIVFEHRPLGEVAAEFNRYGRIPIEIEDSALREIPVSGSFDAGDTESFVAFLETLPGVRVERTPARIRVVKVAPTT